MTTILPEFKVLWLALAAGFAGQSADTAVCISFYESSHRPLVTNTNTNGTQDHGLMQINDYWKRELCSGLNLYSPDENMKCAHRLWDADGQSFRAWVAYLNNKSQCDNYTVTCPEHIPNCRIPRSVIRAATKTCREHYKGCISHIFYRGPRLFPSHDRIRLPP